MSRFLLAAIAFVVLVVAPDAAAASKPPLAERLVGTWRLVSFDLVDGSGNVVAQPMGSKPVGKLTYTTEGTMWALVARRGAARRRRAQTPSGTPAPSP
jgi:Lipocalin-like domain